MQIQEINRCEVCHSIDLVPVLNIGEHPLCDDLVPVGRSEVCSKYPIDIVYCKGCQTAHQRYQVAKKVLFPKSYHYRSRFTSDVLSGMRNLVEEISESLGGLRRLKVLDVGCNDGSLLDIMREFGASTTVGVEPTGASADALGREHDIVNDYFTPEVASELVSRHGTMDVITFTNVFAHIEDLDGLLETVQMLCSDTTVVVVENHYLGAVLEKNQFDTFYHEHPRTYSLTSFTHIARRMNMNIGAASFPSRYGGNIRVMMSRRSLGADNNQNFLARVVQDEAQFFNAFEALELYVEDWRRSKYEEIRAKVEQYGPLPAKAFPGRAAILIECLGLSEDMIQVVYEKPGSMKIGHYVPGTRIPIASDDDLLALEEAPKVIVNFAWHIADEIHGYLKSKGLKSEIIDIMTVKG